VSPYHGSRFNGLAWLEDEEDGCHAKLLRTLIYTTKDGWAITVPAGFETDFASIPQALTWLIPARGVYNRPAMVHDFLYHYAPVDSTTGRYVTQARADAILREACENCDDRFTQRWAIYLGLRVGGWIQWRKYRRQEQAAADAPTHG
jgi:hypothetical protein